MILSNDKASTAIRLDEKSNVERPLLDQLEGLGWTVIRLEQAQTPQQSHRSSFDQVVLLRCWNGRCAGSPPRPAPA